MKKRRRQEAPNCLLRPTNVNRTSDFRLPKMAFQCISGQSFTELFCSLLLSVIASECNKFQLLLSYMTVLQSKCYEHRRFAWLGIFRQEGPGTA